MIIFSCLLKTVRILLCCYVIYALQTIYAASANDNSTTIQSNEHLLELIKLQNDEKWQQFANRMELNDLYFSLHRSISPHEHDRIISAENYPAYVVDTHDKMFCSIQDNKKCQVAFGRYTYGDMRSSILFPTVYIDRKELDLASNFINNITIGVLNSNIALEMRDANDHERELPENKAALATTYVSQARLGLARNSFYTMLQYRTPSGLLGDKSSNGKNKFSIISVMEQEAKDRFENIKWYESIDNGNQEFSLKELAKIGAYQIWMDYHKYKQNERIEALLATMVAQQESINQLLADKNAKNN